MIFIALVVANIIFLIAQLWGGAPVGVPTEAVEYTKNIGNLQTLAERDAAEKQHKTHASTSAQQASSSPAEGEMCQFVGPFAELLHAEYLVEHLGALDVRAQIKNIEIVDGKTFWVYLKPEMSEKEALRRLYELRAKAIDSYIISTGELANGISLGQFGGAVEAAAKAEQLRAQGYDAEVKEVPQSHSETWVQVFDQSGQKLSEEQWGDLLKEEKSIERRQNFCLGVAN